MNSLFGVELPTSVNFVIAFAVVLGLIAAAAWLVRRFGAARLDSAGRSRQPRLAVIDSAAVDGRRKLVIIRRDNVEHLLMIGGPTDVVIETNIIRSAAAAAREAPAARNGAVEALPRAAAAAEPTPWPLQPEPVPAHAVRAEPSARAIAEDAAYHWPTPSNAAGAPVTPPRAARPADALAGLAAELTRASPEGALPQIRPGEAAPAAAAGAPPAPPADQGLAEMAQRLEAALRRPIAKKVAAEGGAPRAVAAAEARLTAREPRAAAAQASGGSPPKAPGNLEQEMASLLGRQGKT
jgi:flagellar protein FliO/FliZ